MANKNTSSPTRDSTGKVKMPGADLNPERKRTIGDYLKNLTAGTPDPEKPNSQTIDTSFKNNFPIDNNAQTQEVDAAFVDNLPNQSKFFDNLSNEATTIYNDISSGAFFDIDPNTGGNQLETIAGEIGTDGIDQQGLKNDQVFGHEIAKDRVVRTISQQVSKVLTNNRFSPRFSIEGEQSGADRDFDRNVGRFRSTATNETLEGFEERNEEIKEQVYFSNSNIGGIARNSDSPLDNRERLQRLGAEAVIAASGYVGNPPEPGAKLDADDNEISTGLPGIWASTFAAFDLGSLTIENVGGTGYGLKAGVNDGLTDGTRRISERSTNPTREWLERRRDPDRKPAINLEYIDSQGRPSQAVDQEQGSLENHSYTVMNSMIAQFIQKGLFSNPQYINSLTFAAAIFVENLLLAAVFDALLAAEFAAQRDQRRNLKAQYNKDTPLLSKGKARGNAVDLTEFLGDGAQKTGDILELLGIPNVQDLLSGPRLVEFVMNFMGINKPIQTKTNFTVKDFKVGDIVSFVPSYLIGSLQTTISALKDPMSAGFFFNLYRQIARKSALSAAPDPTGEGELAFIEYFMELRHQANFRFFITMVNLGDNAIGQFTMKMQHSGGPAIFNKTRAEWGGLSMNPGSVRFSPSMFLIPKSFRNFRKQIGEPDVFISGVSETAAGGADQFQGADRKLTNAQAAQVEAVLEQEYMPFYIKDMRTNEIISFHAFLDTLSDGFTATYGSTTGLGRIEPVKTYESSSRSIGVSFTMIAFSKEDMDMLYWKLNKLVTLMYPQFSKGTQLINGEDKFYMPFSQIQTASPMVRMRIGDILTNNYSNASAARLIGVGFDDGFDINADSSAEAVKTKQIDPTWRDTLTPTDDGGFSRPMTLSFQTNAAVLSQGDIIEISPGRISSFGKIATPGTKVIPPTIKKTKHIIGVPAKPQFLNQEVFTTRSTIREDREEETITDTIVTGDTFKIIGFEASEKWQESGKIKVSGVRVWVVKESIGNRISFMTLKQGINDMGVSRNTGTTSSMELPDTEERQATKEKLLKPSKNAPGGICFAIRLSEIEKIVTASPDAPFEKLDFIKGNTVTRAFHNNSGEGMAGFIDNLQIDWQLGTYNWDITPGSRAPMGCKITLGFNPIHDITPGIDADGFNRAPVYKVGNLSRSVHDGGLLDE
tara:strand:+ start:46469 stop:49954 length:3486 start_codon:yes stop_codon:yes gene_type:complete